MTTEELIIAIFIEVDDSLPKLQKHPQAKLYPSELVTIGILFALKGTGFRGFYRWLKRDHDGLRVICWTTRTNPFATLTQNPSGLVSSLAGSSQFFHSD